MAKQPKPKFYYANCDDTSDEDSEAAFTVVRLDLADYELDRLFAMREVALGLYVSHAAQDFRAIELASDAEFGTMSDATEEDVQAEDLEDDEFDEDETDDHLLDENARPRKELSSVLQKETDYWADEFSPESTRDDRVVINADGVLWRARCKYSTVYAMFYARWGEIEAVALGRRLRFEVTTDAIGLAKHIRESRNVGPLPVLADALQDHGTAPAWLLRKFRQTEMGPKETAMILKCRLLKHIAAGLQPKPEVPSGDG
jgi:hypothetical protein